eukprot:3019636-Rhodomonas_salina.9
MWIDATTVVSVKVDATLPRLLRPRSRSKLTTVTLTSPHWHTRRPFAESMAARSRTAGPPPKQQGATVTVTVTPGIQINFRIPSHTQLRDS